MIKKILVTGATGFVGSHIAKALLEKKEFKTSIILRKSSNTWRINNYLNQFDNVFELDLAKEPEVKALFEKYRPDIIYHIATYGGFPSQGDKEMTVNTNFKATINLLDAAVAAGVEQFINTGSSSEYGAKNHPMRENDLCEPGNLYGITKLAATHYCSMVGKSSSNIKVCTLRLFSPYGENEEATRLYPSIVDKLKRDERPMLSRPNSVRDFIPIQDVINVYLKIIEGNYLSGDIINVGSGKQQTIAQFCAKIASEMGKEHLEPIWGQAAPRTIEPEMWEADISKLKRLMNGICP